MRLTKFGHSCIRLENGADRIVVDPGVFTELGATDDATAVFITHEHPDHWTADHLLRTDAPIYTIAAVAAQLPGRVAERVRVVAPAERINLDATGVDVVGEKHAVIHPELPHFDNSGYLFDVDGLTLFHPGDALTTPEAPIDVLLLPVSAPWMKVSECIDYARAVGAPRNVGIHDMIYSEAGLGIVGGHLGRFLDPLGKSYERLAPGNDLSA